MVVDSSAVFAILQGEPGWERYREAAMAADRCFMSAATLVEAAMVVEGRRGEAGGRELDLLLLASRIEIVAFDAAQAVLAREAFRRFGRGRHPAGLNLGDCFAYALARQLNQPLLFRGDDFSRTDVRRALPA